MLRSIDTMNKNALLKFCASHRMTFQDDERLETIRSDILDHITSGECYLRCECKPFCSVSESDSQSSIGVEIAVIKSCLPSMTLRNLRSFLLRRNIAFAPRDSFSKLRRDVKKYIGRLQSGKRSEEKRNAQLASEAEARKDLHDNWPRVVNSDLKNKLGWLLAANISPECGVGNLVKKGSGLCRSLALQLYKNNIIQPATAAGSCLARAFEA